MDEFLSWFYAFMTTMLVDGVWRILSNFFEGIACIFNFPAYFKQLAQYSDFFNAAEWICAILSFVLAYVAWGVIAFMLVLVIRKYIRFRRTVIGNEDLLEELADLHRDVLRLTQEKERIFALKAEQAGVTPEQLETVYAPPVEGDGSASTAAGVPAAQKKPGAAAGTRFFRLTAVDEKYLSYTPPQYDDSFSLAQLCDDFRNFACSRMHLYYETRTIRLMFAGLASTKLILLQGISGTGKTSLPYAMGKYFINDATIASVQPSWRDRTELFGYFNEFTKKFNETEFLKRIYEASYNDDINVIILDEMNIARVEYYFAEMLSVLEMPDPREWRLELVPSAWEDDPKHLEDGKLTIPQNVWYIGTANNDDSTFAVSDKVYDRALVINLDSKGLPFDSPDTPPKKISYSHVEEMYKLALSTHTISNEYLDAIAKLDLYIIQKFRIAFGNRIMKQLRIFVPVYMACGGEELDGVDYILATKVFRKFESLNMSLIREGVNELIAYMDQLFGRGAMKESISYLQRLQKMQ